MCVCGAMADMKPQLVILLEAGKPDRTSVAVRLDKNWISCTSLFGLFFPGGLHSLSKNRIKYISIEKLTYC